MARHFPISVSVQKLGFLPASFTFLILLTAVFSVFSVVIFLCGGHTAALKSLKSKEDSKTVRLGGKNTPMIKKMRSSLSGKALLMAKMISWRKVVDEGKAEEFQFVEEGGEDGAVWKKTIIKGDKCRPLEFSGKILYDADGNLLPE